MSTAGVAREAIRPVSASERIEIVDVLRGWALFGILWVNIEFFAWPLNYIFQPHDWGNLGDHLAENVMKLLAQGKFYTLFSFLFGFGFSIYLLKGAQAAKSSLPTYARRLLVLLGVGTIHAYLIWMGDILLLYALLGFVMLLFRNCRPRTLLIWCLIFLLVPVAMTFMFATASAANPEAAANIQKNFAESNEKLRTLGESALRVYPSGTYAEITTQRTWEYNTLFSFMMFFGPGVLAMFLLGLWAGKTGLFQNIAAKLDFFRRVMWIGLAIGLPGSIFAVWAMLEAGMMTPTFLSATATLVATFANPALSAFYVSGLILLFHHPTWRPRLEPLRNAGRMALTNYLMQSLICTTIFYGYGLGYFGKIGPRWLPLFVIAIYAMELAWSHRWMQRFQFGPAEWVWRTLTYAKRQPMRLTARAGAAR
jgi:uncharacterized protein